MKTPIHSPILKAAVLSLACATPTLAVLVPSSFPSHADLQAPSSVASPPVASAGFKATFSRMMIEALLAKHDLLSKVNRVERLDLPSQLASVESPGAKEASRASIVPAFGISPLPAEPHTDKPRASEVAALRSTAVKAQRPSGADRRNFGKRNRSGVSV